MTYVFRAKRSDWINLIWWDGMGLSLMAKRLEQGAFKWPRIQEGVMRLTSAQLGALLEDWVGSAAWYLRPLREHILKRLRRSEPPFADEITAPVLNPRRKRRMTDQTWAYACNDRP